MRRAASSTAGLLLILAAPGVGVAQSARSVSGIVVDGRLGRAVAGAEVTLDGPVARTVVTDVDGHWWAPLPEGAYVASVARVGYVRGSFRIDVPLAYGDSVLAVLEPSAIPLDAVVVTAGRRSQLLADVPVTTELVSRSEIRGSGASDLASVLTERTGIQLQGGHPNGAGLMLQGLGSERVLVLVDGQPYIGRISGTVDVSRIPTAIVERVEIVKGPQATLYGSEAMGGVVNVITLGAGEAGWGASGASTAGSEGRLDGSLQVDGHLGETSAWIGLGSRSENLIPGQSEGEGASVERRDLSIKLGRETGALTIDVAGFLVDEDQRWSGGQLYQFADNIEWSGRIATAWTAGDHHVGSTFHLTGFDHLSLRGTSESPPPEGTGSRQIQRLAEAELTYTWAGANVQVDGGIEASREDLETESVLGGDRVVTNVDPFTQATFRVGHVTIVPGLRISWSDAWGTHPTPRLALLWRTKSGLAVRSSVGTGYRAPGSKELFFNFLNTGPGYGYLVRGNPDLGPETSTNVSAGVEWTGARVYGRMQLFHNRYHDFIETRSVADSVGLSVYTYGNIDDGTTRGVEMEAGWVTASLTIEAGWSLLDATDEATGEPLLGRARHSGRLTVGMDLPLGLRGLATTIHTGRTPLLEDESGTQYRTAFTRMDARFSKILMAGITVGLGIDNLLDAAPESWPGYARRRYHVAVEVGRRWNP